MQVQLLMLTMLMMKATVMVVATADTVVAVKASPQHY